MHRKKMPIYRMGSPDPVSFSRGGEEEFPYLVRFLRGVKSVSWHWLRFFERVLERFTKPIPEDAVANWKKSDPQHSRCYNSFAGIDIEMFAEEEGKEPVLVAELQAISVQHTLRDPSRSMLTREFPIRGTLVFVVFDRAVYEQLNKPSLSLVLKATNEYGCRAECRIEGVQLQVASWGISLDDIVMEERVDYRAKSIIPWHPITS
jgi:hypothetical protein